MFLRSNLGTFGMFHNKQGNILLIGINYFHKQTPNISVLTSHVGSLSLRKMYKMTASLQIGYMQMLKQKVLLPSKFIFQTFFKREN